MSEYRFAVTRLNNALNNKRKPSMSYKEDNLVNNLYKRLKKYVKQEPTTSKPQFIELDKFDHYRDLVDNYDSTDLEQQLVDLPEETALDYSTSLLNAVDHLRTEAPRRTIQRLTGPEQLDPNDFEKSEFLRRVKVVDDPIETILSAIEHGNLTNTEIDTLQTVYPQTYDIMKRSIIDILADTGSKLSGRQEGQLRKIMDLPLSDTTMQQNFEQEKQMQPEQPQVDMPTASTVGTKQASGKLG